MDIFLLSYDIYGKQQELNNLNKLNTNIKEITTNSTNTSANTSTNTNTKEYIKVEKLFKLCNQEYEISIFNI